MESLLLLLLLGEFGRMMTLFNVTLWLSTRAFKHTFKLPHCAVEFHSARGLPRNHLHFMCVRVWAEGTNESVRESRLHARGTPTHRRLHFRTLPIMNFNFQPSILILVAALSC